MKHQHPAPAAAIPAAPADTAPAAALRGIAETDPDLPTFEDLEADPEIAPLLDFEPVPRGVIKANGWTPALQRMFIAWLAWHGSPGNAAAELGKARSGIDKVYRSPDADSFRAAWDGALALAEKRRIAHIAARHAGLGSLRPPVLRRTAEYIDAADAPAAPGQVRNEQGEWEDENSYHRRGEEAIDSISQKLQRCRRLYLQEISHSPAHRAAFEILTKLPIDWDKAALGKRQDDEPWRVPNMRTPEMILTAENGWMGGIVHGPDKRVELMRAINQLREEEGLPPVNWEDEHHG